MKQNILKFYFIGFILWVFVCSFFPRKKYSYLELCPNPDFHSNEASKEVFTLASANVLLANEAFCRWNNNRNPMARSKLIGKRIQVFSLHTLTL